MTGEPRIGLMCPKNCGGQIVYNGNYYCENWTYPYESDPNISGQGCDWALSHGDNGEPVGRRDKRVWKLIQATEWFKAATSQ